MNPLDILMGVQAVRIQDGIKDFHEFAKYSNEFNRNINKFYIHSNGRANYVYSIWDYTF